MVADGGVGRDVVVAGRHRHVPGVGERRAPPPASRPSPAGSRRNRHSPFEVLALAGGAVLGAQHGVASRSHPRHGRRQSVAIPCHTGRHGPRRARSTTSPGRPGSRRRRSPGPSPGPGRVNAATAERIRTAADELGYRTNPLARALSTARTRSCRADGVRRQNPFYAEVIRGAQTAASAGGLHDPARRRPGVGRPAERAPDSSACCPPSTASSRRLADVGQRDPDDRQAEAGDRAQPRGPRRPVRRHRQRPRGPAARSSTSPGSATTRSPTSPARRPAGPTACAGSRCGKPADELDLRVRRVGPCNPDRPRRLRHRRGARPSRRRPSSPTTT